LAERAAASAEPDEGIDLEASLAERLEPEAWRPALADDIEVKDFRLRWGSSYTMIANPRDLVHFRLDPDDAAIVKLLDGTRTLQEIVVERLRESGELEVAQVAMLVRELEAANFLRTRYLDVYGELREALDPASTARKKAREFTRTLSIDWKDADRLVSWLYRRGLKVFFRPAVAAASGLVAVAGLVAFVDLVASGRFDLTGRSLLLGLVVLFVLDYFMVFVHELGHALVLTHNGRRIKSAGFMIYFGSPAFFVDSSDSLMMGRRQEILSSFAGPYAQLIVGGASSLIALAFPGWILSPTLYKYAVLNYFVVFMNLIPLLELDGYFILADAIEVPDLRPRSLAFIQRDLWHKLRLHERLSVQEAGLAVYGVAGIVFTVFSFYASFFYWRTVFGGLVSDLWNGGSLLRVLLVALALFVAGPMVRGLIALGRSTWRRGRMAWRRVRFRLESGWRVEAAQLIDALPMFRDLPEDVLNDLAGRVRLRAFPPGQAVVRQGERATAFYVVRSGRLRVVEEDPNDPEGRTLRVLGRGDAFGELALAESAPRSATVRTLDAAEVFEVDKGTFDWLLADMVDVPAFAPTLQAIAELRELPCFAALEPDRLSELLDHGAWVNIPPGRTILSEGAAGDAFYAVRSGRVDVVEGGSRVRTLGPGSHFGEIALLLDVPRTATVSAATPVRAFRLDRNGFDRLVADAFRRGALDPAISPDQVWEH
jgi:CRP-like cAMP-binding protein/Zn-dependent protease